MPSTRAIGRRNELKTRDYLIERGYRVCVAPMPTKWATENDMWGLWDLVAISDEEVLFVQVKTNKNSTYGKALKQHRDFVVPDNCRKECWLWERMSREPFIIDLTD